VGVNFIVLPNSTDQVPKLLDLIAEIDGAVDNGPGLDFLTLREDYSVTEAEGLTVEEREHLLQVFQEFNTRLEKEFPHLYVDYGYALMTLSEGVLGKPLAMVTHEEMRPMAFPQISVVIDLLGDVYIYHEAGFLDRPGADRYKIGTVTKTRSLEVVVQDFLESGRGIEPLPTDPQLMDAFDHVVTKVINQAESDEKTGIPFNQGPIQARLYYPDVGDGERRVPSVFNTWYETPSV
jgi:dTDP-4-amino-4,6-dideoxy-D-glucose ammonia-lyase